MPHSGSPNRVAIHFEHRGCKHGRYSTDEGDDESFGNLDQHIDLQSKV
jgi:hypothetical protein